MRLSGKFFRSGLIVIAIASASFIAPIQAQSAAEELHYTEDKATVVLITDGIETCKADICELGKLLESQGVDFTTHVVGFGLSIEEGRQVACLAENTGGQYFSADDGASLVVALNETVAAPVAPPIEANIPNVTLVAVDQNQRQLTNVALNWEVKDAAGSPALQSEGKAKARGPLKPGSYTVSVSGEGTSGGAEFEIAEGNADQTKKVPVEMEILAATLNGPAEVAAGAELEIAWTGPSEKNDYVAIVKKGAKKGKFLKYSYTKNGSPAKIKAPDGLGTYELRYVLAKLRRTLVSVPIKLGAATATISAPASTTVGNVVEVTWSGPSNANDTIEIVPAGAKANARPTSKARTTQGSPLSLFAPEKAGDYEVRYKMKSSGQVLAKSNLKVE